MKTQQVEQAALQKRNSPSVFTTSGPTGWPVPQAVLTPLGWEISVGQGLFLYTSCLCHPCVSSRQALFGCLFDIMTYVIPGSESLFGVGTEAHRSVTWPRAIC